VIDQDLLTAVQYALVEPPTGGLSWASDLWTTPEMYAFLDIRQQRLLKLTHLQVGIGLIAGLPTVNRYALPDDWIASVMVLWDQTTDGVRRVRELFRTDMMQADLGLSSWEVTAGTPLAYSDADTPTRTIQLVPAPDALGWITVLYVPLASTPTGVGEELQVPDEWCHPVMKYGVLANALSKVGRAQDPQRAAYSEWRFQLGVEVSRLILNGWG
jgi:hypothetical protein